MQYSNPENSPSIKTLFSLKNRSSLIIGGAGLLGSEMSYALAELDSNLVIASRNKDKCKNICEKIALKYPNISANYHEVDITNLKSIEKLYNFISDKYGKLDVLINSGTSNKKNDLDSISFDDWDHDIEITLNGVFKTIKTFLPLLKKSNGNIVNIASIYGQIAPDYRLYDKSNLANPPSYGSSKAGVIQLTKYLSSFLAKYKIRVNSISPGPFPFEMTQKENPEFIKKLSNKIPLNRIGAPHELKGIIALLCSDAGSYINGQNVFVDGGWSVW